MQKRNLSKPFSIAGFVLGEIYMLFIVFAPRHAGDVPTLAYNIKLALTLSVFCGVFGALIGLGIGLLVSAALPPKK